MVPNNDVILIAAYAWWHSMFSYNLISVLVNGLEVS